jgi:hypothetical protein
VSFEYRAERHREPMSAEAKALHAELDRDGADVERILSRFNAYELRELHTACLELAGRCARAQTRLGSRPETVEYRRCGE